jgi:hypothetical protein
MIVAKNSWMLEQKDWPLKFKPNALKSFFVTDFAMLACLRMPYGA